MSQRGRAELRDLIIPLAVVAVVGMMLFPLPRIVLDSLLMCNIAFALCLLISSVYLAEPSKFTSLPTILLLATLFRLGLNVSTTRQLLARGEAPDVIVAFGNFVASGNLVVGVVVFAIVTLVQFLVIAKGAERIAEVAARFTLDAMPGKQMSIDADVRAGIIGLAEAKQKRRELHRESKLYGALDGAMKFVKGDAIAGLLITIINISAGLIVGVTQQGLSLSQAGQKYVIFTIGDGLVSQIPALLVAVAAGIAVTRVEDQEQSLLSRDVFKQLTEEPQALFTTGFVLFALALVPGLPIVPFLFAAIVFLAVALRGRGMQQRSAREQEENEFTPKVFSAIVFRVSAEAALQLQQERRLPNLIQETRASIFDKWGVVVADVQFDIDASLNGVTLDIYLHGVRIAGVRADDDSALSQSMSFSDQVTATFVQFVERHLAELVDDTQTRMLLEVHQPVAEDLINSVVPTFLSVTALTTLLRQLVVEGVSVRELRAVLQAVAEFYGELEESSASERQHAQSVALHAAVRERLARTISRSIANEDWQVHAWVLAPAVDRLITRAATNGAPVAPELLERLVAEIRQNSEQSPEKTFVLLTTKFARVVIAELLRNEDEAVRVVAVSELSREVKLSVQGELLASLELDVSRESRNEEPSEDIASSKVSYLVPRAA